MSNIFCVSQRGGLVINRVFILCALLLIAGCGPVLIFPGGKLEGSVSPVPQDWSFTDNIKTIQLETRPDDPYSVNIWVIGLGSDLYVHAGANRATWVEHIEGDANVRVRIEANIYALRAIRVDDQTEFASFSEAYAIKYDRRPRNENVVEAYLFRLLAPNIDDGLLNSEWKRAEANGPE